MENDEKIFVSISGELESYLLENGISFADVLSQAKIDARLVQGQDPASSAKGNKEPATILIASAAVIAAATPILREVLHTISGRKTSVKERGLVQLNDAKGKPQVDDEGNPVTEWREIERENVVAQQLSIKAFGIEISFG